MAIVFLVAGLGERVNGGTRVIYEHANRLAGRGHDVHISHFALLPGVRLRTLPRVILRSAAWWLHGRRQASWFDFLPSVTRSYRLFGERPRLAPHDIVIATYWSTHELLDEATLRDFRCFYFIQGFEDFVVDANVLFRHWKSPSRNIVVSKWLKRKVEAVCGKAHFVPNAIDFSRFRDLGLRSAEGNTVLFLSLASSAKGSADAVRAINRLRQSGRTLSVLSFGDVHPAQFGLDGPVEHHHRPPQGEIEKLYSRANVFVAPSLSEGWGLTLGEATGCGAALLVSDATGHFEVVRPGRSAFFFRRGDSERLADKLAFMIDRPSLQLALNRSARADFASYNWDAATDAMEGVLGVGH